MHSYDAVPFHLIANDGTVMEHAIPLDGTRDTETGILPSQSIGERYDIIVDFALHGVQAGDRLYFVNVLEHRNGKRPHVPVPLGQILSGRYEGDPCVEKFFEFRVEDLNPAVNGGIVDSSMDPRDFEPGKQTMIPVVKFTVAELQNATFRKFSFVRNNGGGLTPWAIKTDNGDAIATDPRRLSAAPRRMNHRRFSLVRCYRCPPQSCQRRCPENRECPYQSHSHLCEADTRQEGWCVPEECNAMLLIENHFFFFVSSDSV